MKKREEVSSPDSCLNKAGDDEPVFVLRAHDKAAPAVVRFWAVQARSRGAPKEKTDAALAAARDMEAWQALHGAKVPD